MRQPSISILEHLFLCVGGYVVPIVGLPYVVTVPRDDGRVMLMVPADLTTRERRELIEEAIDGLLGPCDRVRYEQIPLDGLDVA